MPASSSSPSPTQTSIPEQRRGHRTKPSSLLRRNMQSLIARGKSFLTPTQSSTNLAKSSGFQTVKKPEQLFPTVDPAVDGDECLHDCSTCTITLPRKWEIDEEDNLYGHVKGWDTHLIVATGKNDWVRDIADEKGSLMEEIASHGLEVANGKVMLSASDMPTGNDGHDESVYAHDGRTRCLVLPQWRMVEDVGRAEVNWLMDEVVAKGATNLSPLKWQEDKLEVARAEDDDDENNTVQNGNHNGQSDTTKPNDNQPDLSTLSISNPVPKSTATTPAALSIPQGITLIPCPHRAIILLCSHKTRDWRCGASAPLLRRELERHLRPLGLYRDVHDNRPDGVAIHFINHVGGHKYSANVMVYRRGEGGQGTKEATQGIWLARVRPEDCEGIVKYTVLKGKVVKPVRQLRGGFDRSGEVMSW